MRGAISPGASDFWDYGGRRYCDESSDGKSLLTSVGVTDNTIWIHNGSGDRQFSSEGDAFGLCSHGTDAAIT